MLTDFTDKIQQQNIEDFRIFYFQLTEFPTAFSYETHLNYL